ncbi:hypothetical protein ECBP1_0077 [Escherichia phage ECBP1]|uniref:Uncharacterized protein n=1 Tax=Escherichia phage ECBP1 TaxID=1604356 RepID=J9RVR7_9CAUD|nr:hypothetical protein ECBP1_0077 [Escherichia phage ECBP1]AFR52027.1 hypothetical protein ECBP1_0077 [Escherichia phage ECBP1]
MRIYMKAPDSSDKYFELDHTKIGFLSDDIIITHDEDTYHELAGMMLLENRPGIKVLEPRETYSLDKTISSLVFFTKLPHSVSVRRSKDSVRMTVTM